MLKGVLALVASDDVARLQFHTAPEQAWSRVCAEGDDGALGHESGVRYARQVLAIRVRFAVKCPRAMTVISIVVARIASA
jgi:hypothetical protein